MLIYAVGPKYLTTAKRLVDSIRVHDAALPILVAHASGVDTKDGALYEEVRELLRTWRRVYDLGYAKKVSVDQPSLWVAQRNTPGLRIQVLDVTMSCRVHDSFSQCGRFSARPANFVTEHTRRAKACVLIHGHNLSAAPARRPHRSGEISPAG